MMERPIKPDLAYNPGRTRDYIVDLENYCTLLEQTISALRDDAAEKDSIILDLKRKVSFDYAIPYSKDYPLEGD
jgi:hypothetical protein